MKHVIQHEIVLILLPFQLCLEKTLVQCLAVSQKNALQSRWGGILYESINYSWWCGSILYKMHTYILTAVPKLRCASSQGFGFTYEPSHSTGKYLEAKELKSG